MPWRAIDAQEDAARDRALSAERARVVYEELQHVLSSLTAVHAAEPATLDKVTWLVAAARSFRESGQRFSDLDALIERGETLVETHAGDQVTLALLKPDMMRNVEGSIDELLEILEGEEFELVLRATFTFSEEQARAVYSDGSEWSSFHELLQFMQSGESMLLLLRRRNAIQHWRKLLEGSVDTWRNGERLPSLRYRYGEDPDEGRNGLHGATSAAEVARQLHVLRSVPAVHGHLASTSQ